MTEREDPKTAARIARRRRRRAVQLAEGRSLREQALQRFGAAADERQQPDRRAERTLEEQEQILRAMGIVDRRRLNRRHR